MTVMKEVPVFPDLVFFFLLFRFRASQGAGSLGTVKSRDSNLAVGIIYGGVKSEWQEKQVSSQRESNRAKVDRSRFPVVGRECGGRLQEKRKTKCAPTARPGVRNDDSRLDKQSSFRGEAGPFDLG